MKILGINIGHDSGVCLMKEDGYTAINEERLSRIKMHHGFPYLALDEVLSINQLSIQDIDLITIEGKKIMPQFDVGFSEKEGDWKKQLLSSLGMDQFFLGSEAGLALTRMILKPQVAKVKQKTETYLREKG
jgi:predicted NodU family carbamoyl transferase